MGKHVWYDCIWTITHVRDGKVIWSEEKKNSLVDEGEKSLLNSYFRATDSPTKFYIRLCRDSVLEADTLTDIQNEPSGNGYAAVEVTRDSTGFPTIEMDSGDWRVVSKEVSFTASGGDIGPVNTMYLATTSDNLGVLIAFVDLSIERTALDGDTLYAQMRIKAK